MIRSKFKLHGKRVLITAPLLDNKMKATLENLGAKVIWKPAISIKPLKVTIKLKNYDLLVFSSKNGVIYFVKNCIESGINPKHFQVLKTCAIGRKTANELHKFGLDSDIIPTKYTSKELAKRLSTVLFRGAKILYPGANIRNKNIDIIAKSRGAIVKKINVYKIILEKFQADADMIIFTSAMQVKVAKKHINLKDKLLVSIGPETTKEIRKSGLKPTITAKEHSYDGIVKEILAYFRSRR